MLRQRQYGGKLAKSDNLSAGKDLTFNMERSDGLKNLHYDITFTVNHDNAGAITTDTYDFLKNILQKIMFITGAGDNIFDLTSTQMAIIQLVEEGRLRFSIDKTIGNGKISTVMLRWNFTLPKYYENPMDTVFHSDNMKYNYVQLKFKPQSAFTSITDCTINSVGVKVKEVFKKNPTPKMVLGQPVPPLNKVIKVKDFGYNSTVTGQIIELPQKATILGAYIYVVDENEVVKSDAITNVSIKNGNEYFYDASFTEINEETRDQLQTWGNSLLDNIAYIDIAQGQITEALQTASSEHRNTALSFDLVASAGTNILKILFVTVEDA